MAKRQKVLESSIYLTVPKAEREKIRTIIGDSIQFEIVIGDEWVCQFELLNSTSEAYTAVHKFLEEECIPFNCMWFAGDYWPQKTLIVRYTKEGCKDTPKQAVPDPSYREILQNMLCVHLQDATSLCQLIMCYTAYDSWEDYVRNGKMYRMRQLIGG